MPLCYCHSGSSVDEGGSGSHILLTIFTEFPWVQPQSASCLFNSMSLGNKPVFLLVTEETQLLVVPCLHVGRDLGTWFLSTYFEFLFHISCEQHPGLCRVKGLPSLRHMGWDFCSVPASIHFLSSKSSQEYLILCCHQAHSHCPCGLVIDQGKFLPFSLARFWELQEINTSGQSTF